MPFLVSWEQRERSTYFDRLTTRTAEILTEPTVVRALDNSLLGPKVAAGIREVTANWYLPNLNHRVASAPSAYRHSGRTALLPVIGLEILGVRFGESIWDDKTHEARLSELLAEEATARGSERFDATTAAAKLHARGIAKAAKEHRRMLHRHAGTCWGEEKVRVPGLGKEPVASFTRAAVFLAPLAVPEKITPEERLNTAAVDAIHEGFHTFTHSVRQSLIPPTRAERKLDGVAEELRARHLHYLVLEAANLPAEYDIMQAEILRTQYNGNEPATAFEPTTPGLITALNKQHVL